MSVLYSFLIGTSIFSGIVLILMVLTQQTSNSGLLSNNSTHFAPGKIDDIKHKITAAFAIFFIGNILMLWVVNNKIISNSKKVSIVESVIEQQDKKSSDIVPIE